MNQNLNDNDAVEFNLYEIESIYAILSMYLHGPQYYVAKKRLAKKRNGYS